MPQEKAEITLIQPRPSKPASLWANMITLIVLFGLIIGAKRLSDHWLKQAPPPEAEENQIVLEDLEEEKPLAESPSIEMPEQKVAQQNEKPKKPKKVVRVELTPTRTDPYTDGGPLDLDRPENQEKGPTKILVPQEATAIAPLPLDERDQFIPFE